ncbi:MAG: hemolysin III family protein [Phycisphaerae bacterium]|nr:hemolysin III family protein [Gemmatimonadaceae bacterium]
MSNSEPPAKPRWRGVLHQWSAPVALSAGAWLTSVARGQQAVAAGAIFTLSLFVLFTVSALYHRVTWSPVARARMRRADHASIFVLIFGTYTPIALVGLPTAPGRQLLLWAGVGALLGVLKSLFWNDAPKTVTAVLAVGVGWSIVPFLSDVQETFTPTQRALLTLGGVAYTIGAIVYATKRPRLWPQKFGYHEAFHLLTIVAAALHFALVHSLVTTGLGATST